MSVFRLNENVSLSLPDDSSPCTRYAGEELIRLLAARRYECVVRVADGSYREFLRMLDRAGKTDAAATLLVGAFPEKELRAILRALPGSILLDDPGKDVPECVYSIFSFDNEQAAVLAVRHLLERKRRRILLVTGPAEHFFSREVESGWRAALEDAGLRPDPALILHTDFTVSEVTHAYAMFERGLMYDWCLSGGEYSLPNYAARMMPMFLRGFHT